MKLRALVVDDEPVARRLLCAMVATVDWLDLVGEADCAAAALQALDVRELDLVFLDVRLPDASGLEVAERVAPHAGVVFTTAYDEYAIRALQLGALDYLVKPFGRRRFLEAADRARQRLAHTPSGTAVRPQQSASRPSPPRRLFVRDRGVIVPVTLDRVARIEAKGDYSEIVAEGRVVLIQQPLGALDRLLDPGQFVRVHRSHIVNLDYVTALRPFDARRYTVVLRGGFETVASAAGTRLLRALIV